MASHGIALTGPGPELKGRCPFHEDDSPSLSVNREKGVWHCFGCGASGNVEGFLSRVNGGAHLEKRPRITTAAAPAKKKAEPLSDAQAEALAALATEYQAGLAAATHARAYLKERVIAFRTSPTL